MIEVMEMYILDTNICIAIIKKHPNAIQEFKSKASLCYISTIVLGELYKGVYCSSRRESNLTILNGLLNLLGIVDFDHTAAEEFGKIQAELRLIGKPTGEMDALIGAVALSQQAILVTNNIRHFENIQNITLENWLDSP